MFYIFGSEIKVHRSVEVPGYTEITMRATRDIQSTSSRDKNIFKLQIMDLEF